jgi:hypothetical protein
MLHSKNAKIKKPDRTVSALPLFVTRVLANDPHDAFSADYLAMTANALHRRQNFHVTTPQNRRRGKQPFPSSFLG